MARINKRITSRYSKALLDVSIEQGISADINKDMMLIAGVLMSNEDLRKLLRNSVVKNYRKKKIMHLVFSSKIHKLSLAFIDLVIDKHHEDILSAIIMEYGEAYMAFQGIKTAYVKTASPLTDALRKVIRAKLTAFSGKKIELVEDIDPKLLGGYLLQIGDFRYDCSLEEKFRLLSSKFEKNIYQKGY
jgi:F-type H+-transporting ATPase subunit delta